MPKLNAILGLSKQAYKKRARVSFNVNVPSTFARDPNVPAQIAVGNLEASDNVNVAFSDNNGDNSILDEINEYINCLLSDADDEIVDIQEETKFFLRTWTNSWNINKGAVSELLKHLRGAGFPNLPADSRTLLHTPKVQSTISVLPGLYSHIGLKDALDSYMSSSQLQFTELSVDFNIDGVPISKSSSSAFWLMLAQIFGPNAYRKIYVVGVYHGFNKPKSFIDFL